MRAPVLMVTSAQPSLERDHGAPERPHLGRLVQPRHTSSVEKTASSGMPWAADNDCFQGLKTEQFVRMLDRLAGCELERCAFVTAPDVVGDAVATLEAFEVWAPELERRGLPVGLVAQDGLELERVPWDRIAAVFVGGSDDYKLGAGAAELARQAVARGKWVHWGRVNTRRRFDHIVATRAATSFDGSKWARWRTTYLEVGLGWCEALEAELA